MKFKNIGSLVKAIGKGVEEYGPQIMAVGSAVCFVAGVIFAAKESPAAFEALEEKKAENEDMNLVEQAATVVSRMPKTVVATASGLLMHIFAWKKILGKVAALTGMAALYKQDSIDLVETAKEVVGPDKAKEIVKAKHQMTRLENGESWEGNVSEDEKCFVMYPYTWEEFGVTVWMTPAEYEERTNENICQLADNQELPLFDYFYNYKATYPPTQDIGWGVDGSGINGSDLYRWAKDELHAELNVHQYKGKYPGFLVKLDNMPTEAIENR